MTGMWTILFVALSAHIVHGHPNFDAAMQRDQYPASLSGDGASYYEFYKNKYERALFTPSGDLKIPKIIHQIWLGSPFPERFKQFQKTIRELHPDWVYVLWTDEQVARLQLENRDLYNRARNYGEKSDILRYELLYRLGGVYLDVDIACVKSLEELHRAYDFYIGLQPLDIGAVQLGTGVIGCRPRHWLMANIVKNLRKTTNQKQIIMRTGPYYFTRMFMWCMEHIEHSTHDVALPAPYFYPLGYTQKVETLKLPPESYTVHYWAGSWR